MSSRNKRQFLSDETWTCFSGNLRSIRSAQPRYSRTEKCFPFFFITQKKRMTYDRKIRVMPEEMDQDEWAFAVKMFSFDNNVLVKELHLENGSTVELENKNGSIVLTPRTKKASLTDMLSKITLDTIHSKNDFSGELGKEIWRTHLRVSKQETQKFT